LNYINHYYPFKLTPKENSATVFFSPWKSQLFIRQSSVRILLITLVFRFLAPVLGYLIGDSMAKYILCIERILWCRK